ncbi:MAG: hypothetical protein FJ308_21365 [Planctomycetes bacterium]|nr:hypothetical protein [Planctomycetota bacterium]
MRAKLRSSKSLPKRVLAMESMIPGWLVAPSSPPKSIGSNSAVGPSSVGLVALWLSVIGIAGCESRTDEIVATNATTSSTTPSAHISAPSDLMEFVDQTILENRDRRLLSVDRNAAWQVAHGAVAYGLELPLDVQGERVLALDYLFSGGVMRGWQLTAGPVHPVTGRPMLKAFVEAGSYVGQGHVDQFLGYISQNHLPLDLEVLVDNQTLTLEDWGRTAQWEVPNNPYREYSWTLIALTNLFPNDYEWKAADGQTWTLEPLVEFEAKQDIAESPCGGMHRLMGLAHAVKYWKARGLGFRGGWALADQVVRNSIDTIRKFQNSDGTFSANYTSRPGTSSDLTTRIGTTGHTLEFIAFALDDREIQQAWVERSVRRLCEMLQAANEVELECGGLYHGLAGLKLYRDRMQSLGAKQVSSQAQ